MARHFDKTTVEYTQEEIQEAMEAWAREPNVVRRLSLWNNYVDCREGYPIGTTASKLKGFYWNTKFTIPERRDMVN